MRTKWMGMLVATAILASLAIAAVALGPANLLNLGSPGGGNTAQASSIGVPTWHVGDFWTYHVDASAAVATLSPFVRTGNVARVVADAGGERGAGDLDWRADVARRGLVDLPRGRVFGGADVERLRRHGQRDADGDRLGRWTVQRQRARIVPCRKPDRPRAEHSHPF